MKNLYKNKKQPLPWRRGYASECARKAGITPKHFSEIFARRRIVSHTLAARLERVTGIRAAQFLDCRAATDRAFAGPVLPPIRDFWGWGVLRATAIKAGISQAHLSNIVHRRERATPRLALKLVRVTGVPACEWVVSRTSTHRAFFGAPYPTL